METEYDDKLLAYWKIPNRKYVVEKTTNGWILTIRNLNFPVISELLY